MNILDALKQLRDDIKTWVANNLNELNKRLTKSINNIPKFSGDYNDLTNAPDISEDGSGNMIIADKSGNIIFKADADGIHTTAVSLNGEAAATEKYVDEAVANVDVDLTGYATEDFVVSAVESAKEELSESIESESDGWKIVDEAGNIIFSVDASGTHTTELTLNGKSAATESYVDEAIANIDIPETDFTGYATETYVDNKVADLVNSAPEALNTLGELATALENHEDAYDALLETVGSKATHTDLENLKEELSESITSEADEWKVVDDNGNIIFSVDADGAHTTSMTLNGQSVQDMIDDKVDKVDGKGLSTNDFTNEYKAKLDNINEGGGGILVEEDPTVPAWAKKANKPSYTAEEVGALADTTVLADLTDDATHRTVTDAEKTTWNAKSDFSGDYNDLNNAPDISEDGSGDLIIADKDGNIIFRSNGNGFETVNLIVENLTVDGKSVQSMIETYVEAAILGGEW